MLAKIALFSPPFTALTYSLPPGFPDSFWREGLRVAVPLGSRLRSGYLLEFTDGADLPPGAVCKSALWPLEREPILSDELLALARDLAARQGSAPGAVFAHTLPAPLKNAAFRLRSPSGLIDADAVGKLSERDYAALAGSFLAGETTFSEKKESAADEIFDLAVDPPWPLRPGAKKQIALLDYLHREGPRSRKAISQALGSGAGETIKALLGKGHIILKRDEERIIAHFPAEAPVRLTDEQRAAFEGFRVALNSGEAACRLLYGVTGGGKTAVYLELIKECLAAGKSAMLLAPEVALAHKLYGDAIQAIGDASVCLFHGYLSASARSRLFSELAASEEPRLIVGARSALFLPAPKLGCVILDEEHDDSWKQDEGFVYQAREVAWFRMRKNRGLLVLGSATPDIKTFYAARSGILPFAALTKRVGGASLPSIELVNIGGASAPGSLRASGEGVGLLAPACEEALRECLKRGEQAVILLNRRGYAPLIYCVDCARVLRCPHCEVGLSYHKSVDKLICHYCGYAVPYPSPCPECRKTNFLPIGEGTEKIAERLAALAGREILRLDRDSARRSGRLEEILTEFGENRSPILVGTQMLSKGHHFPNVTLAIVADGDVGLNLPDYRAAERTFQLLAQTSGRAGRGGKAGRALVQTRDVNHYCWKYVVNSDYEGFYAEELARRKKRFYPPFSRLALLRLSFPMTSDDGPRAINDLRAFIRELAPKLDITALGPAPAPIGLLRRAKRFQCLLKAKEWKNIRELYFAVLRRPFASRLKISLDLDPVNSL